MPAVRKTKRSRQDEAPFEVAVASDDTSDQEAENSSKRGSPRKRMERKGPWLPAEDEILVALVNRLGAHSWSKIATHIPGRVGKQCRERYYNHLAPEVNKEPWTPEEELRVMKLHAEHGNSWALISRLLNTGRTANDVKNLWNCALKKRMLESGEEEVMAETQAEVDSGCTSSKRRGRVERERKFRKQISVGALEFGLEAEPLSDVAEADDEDGSSPAGEQWADDAAPQVAPAAQMPLREPVAASAAQQPQMAPQQQMLQPSQDLIIAPEPIQESVQQVAAPVAAVPAKIETTFVSAFDLENSPYESSESTASVSPPATSISPSPFVLPFELAMQSQMPVQQASSSSFFSMFPTAPSDSMFSLEQDVPMWWTQDVESDGSC